MSVERLAAAIRETYYLKLFDRHQYAKAFQEFMDRFGPLYREEILSAGEEGMAPLAKALMDELENGWRRQRFWNRSAAQVNEKQMLVTYLSPMLLGLEPPLCTAFAKALRDEWGSRRPKDTYRIASYTTLSKGFRNTIMGIDVDSFVNRKEKEAQDDEAF